MTLCLSYRDDSTGPLRGSVVDGAARLSDRLPECGEAAAYTIGVMRTMGTPNVLTHLYVKGAYDSDIGLRLKRSWRPYANCMSCSPAYALCEATRSPDPCGGSVRVLKIQRCQVCGRRG